VVWEGRFQIVRREPVLVVDGAHNPEAARRFREGLVEYFGSPGEPGFAFSGATLVIGASLDKDTGGVLRELVPYFDGFVATASRHPRALPAEELAAHFAALGVDAKVVADVAAAVKSATADKDRLVCVTGSLFVVGEALEAAR